MPLIGSSDTKDIESSVRLCDPLVPEDDHRLPLGSELGEEPCEHRAPDPLVRRGDARRDHEAVHAGAGHRRDADHRLARAARQHEHAAPRLGVAVAATIGLGYVIVSNFYPVPEFPFNILPFVFAGILLAGLTWYAVHMILRAADSI